jgi:hypothetical protein
VKIFCEEQMRIVALLAFFCIYSEVALSETPECRSIPKASDRLVCYDKAAPPLVVGKSSASKTVAAPDKPASPSTPADPGPVDMLAIENSKLDARLKTICRGC